MPTRIISKSATLIDHIYWYEGRGNMTNLTLKSGNLLNDLSYHLPNYMLLMNEKEHCASRPLIRVFSQKNKKSFSNCLQTANWSLVLNENNANIA